MRILLILSFFSIYFSYSRAQKKYSASEIREDLKYLYSALQESHYNLFAITSEKQYSRSFDTLYDSITDSLDLISVYRKLQPFAALSEMGHCTLEYPFGRIYGNYITQGGPLFPLNIQIENQKAFITGNFSGNDLIKSGMELISINEVSTNELISRIYGYLSGESSYFKNTLLDMISLPRMLWILEKTAACYDVELTDSSGKLNNYSIKPLPAGNFEEMIAGENQLFHTSRVFRIIDSVAYLRPGSFTNLESGINGSDSSALGTDEFTRFVDSVFSEIRDLGLDDLVIDLRNNPGGSNTFSDKILAYIAHRPFKFCSTFEVKTSRITREAWRKIDDPELRELKEQILNHDDGEIFQAEIPLQQPKPESIRFTGNVYALINRYSYSQATVTAAMISDYDFGTLIGETTADVPTTYGSIHQFQLPNSKISVSYPKAFIVRPNGDTSVNGTRPDIYIEPDFFTEEDEILENALRIIRK